MSAGDMVPAYSFQVSLDSISFSFSKVTNISSSIQYDAIVEGGSNDAPLILPKPKSSPDMLTLEKGVTTSLKAKVFALIKEGCKISEIEIDVLKDGKTVRSFYASDGVIVAKQFSDLDASESAMFVEALHIAHTGLTEMPSFF